MTLLSPFCNNNRSIETRLKTPPPRGRGWSRWPSGGRIRIVSSSRGSRLPPEPLLQQQASNRGTPEDAPARGWGRECCLFAGRQRRNTPACEEHGLVGPLLASPPLQGASAGMPLFKRSAHPPTLCRRLFRCRAARGFQSAARFFRGTRRMRSKRTCRPSWARGS